jgi:hypothetical protein
MDSFRLTLGSREVQNDHVMSCINWLRAQAMYRHAGLVYVPENAPGSRGGELAYQLRGVKNSLTMAEYGKDMRPGVPKMPHMTENMVLRMRRMLANDSLHFAENLATYGGHESNPALMIDQLCAQLLAFQRVPTQRDGARTKWSGKTGLSGRDDLAVATLMAPYWAEMFYDSSQYSEFRRDVNEHMRYVY